MLKKVLVLSLFLSIMTGCQVIDSSTTNEEVFNLAHDAKIKKENMSGYGYTFTISHNSYIEASSMYSTSIHFSNIKYSMHVNIAKYLEERNIVVATADGNYTLAPKSSSGKKKDDYIYEYRKIHIKNEDALSVEQNQAKALEIVDKLNATGDPAGNFEKFAIDYSQDSTTSTSGGNVGAVTASQLDDEAYEVLSLLEDGEVGNDPVPVKDGFDVVMLVKKYQNTQVVEETIDKNDESVLFSKTKNNLTSYIVKNDNDTYSVVTKSSTISVGAIVREDKVNQALYNTITTARSINVNEALATDLLLNPPSDPNSTEIYNLNATNDSLSTQVQATYKQNFSTSLSEFETNEDENPLDFDTRDLTDEEYEQYLNKSNEKK